MTEEKPVEASLDWKQGAHKCPDWGSNLGPIGAKRGKIRCTKLLPPMDALCLTQKLSHVPPIKWLHSIPFSGSNSMVVIVFIPASIRSKHHMEQKAEKDCRILLLQQE